MGCAIRAGGPSPSLGSGGAGISRVGRCIFYRACYRSVGLGAVFRRWGRDGLLVIVAGDKRAVPSDGNVPYRVITSEFRHGNGSYPGPGAIDVSVIMPCLDEEAALAGCIHEALGAIAGLGVRGEVVVVDNGSTDESVRVAREAGARVVMEPQLGYGRACRRGLRESRGRFLILGDADGSYDFTALPHFVEPLLNGAEMVMGSRLAGTIEPGAMPWLHRRVGNPLLTRVIGAVFSSQVSDVYCGLRSISRSAYRRLSLRATGFEFATEFLIEAEMVGVAICEVPIHYRRRAGGVPKLRTARDGWRTVRLIASKTLALRRVAKAHQNGGDTRHAEPADRAQGWEQGSDQSTKS